MYKCKPAEGCSRDDYQKDKLRLILKVVIKIIFRKKIKIISSFVKLPYTYIIYKISPVLFICL